MSVSVTAIGAGKQAIAIDRMEVVNYPDEFGFERNEDGDWIYRYNHTGKLKRKKSYSVKVNVYPEGAAYDQKPVTATFKITVK